MLKPHWLFKAAGVAALLVLGAFLAGACQPGEDGWEAAYPPSERVFYIAAVEYEYSTTVDEVPFPEVDPAEAYGPGFGVEWIEEGKEWEVEAYAWAPSTLVVYEGDTVRLNFFGANDDSHPSVIEGYDIEFDVTMGRVTEVEFAADKAGVFKISCTAHPPHMSAELLVLPRP